MSNLEGRVALVTGAARGIGAEIALQFARAGARVGVLDLTKEQAGDTVAAVTAAGGQALPVRRIGQPSDIANAALFFAAAESGFVTGQVLYVDGGRTLV